MGEAFAAARFQGRGPSLQGRGLRSHWSLEERVELHGSNGTGRLPGQEAPPRAFGGTPSLRSCACVRLPPLLRFGPPVARRLALCYTSGLGVLRRHGCPRLGTPGRSRGHREGCSCGSASLAELGRMTESSWNIPAKPLQGRLLRILIPPRDGGHPCALAYSCSSPNQGFKLQNS